MLVNFVTGIEDAGTLFYQYKGVGGTRDTRKSGMAIHIIFLIVGGAKFPEGMLYFLKKFGVGIPSFRGCQIICDTDT